MILLLPVSKSRAFVFEGGVSGQGIGVISTLPTLRLRASGHDSGMCGALQANSDMKPTSFE